MKSPEGSTESRNKDTKKNGKKLNFFLVFLICWLVVVTGFVAWFLLRFNDFAASYEQQYQDSLPYHTADIITQRFNEHDVEYIVRWMAQKPAVTGFEDETVIEEYVSSLIEGKSFIYSETEAFREDAPEYYIKTSDGLIVARAVLEEDKTQIRPYGFKAWRESNIEFYTAASCGFNVTAPETYKVYVNGIELNESNSTCVVTESELNQYVDPYATIPDSVNYQGTGLYVKPVVTAVDYLGNACDCVYDEATDTYTVSFVKDFEDYDDLADFAISFTSTFANYISQDAGDYALDKYFPSGSQTLKYIKRNSSRDLYTRHGSVSINNEEIRDCVVFSDDVVYMEVYVEQWMEMYWGSDEPEVLPTDAHIYFVRIDGKWYVGGIQY